ncbi:Uncharacterized protein OBRU01_19269 [Operophtera brumata]|uniref:Uncharacterized protein n=1 Tax=Operophtera brumata TaxID=104452 RepID=A0A0L7KX13_OPEBR|nr:Uncharacterized protein OBRU01_19269 [Operophtera brumata]
MACVLIWLVHSSTEDFTIEPNAMTDTEAVAAHLSGSLACGALLALLLPTYTADAPPERTLAPPHPRVLESAAWRSKPALWPALAHALNHLAQSTDHRDSFREKRVGILKPQGSLERAREERAMATQDDIQVMKSLANIPIGKKTGGILSLKDKSGYPHLVNTDPEPKKEKEEVKKEPKASQTSQPFQPKHEQSPNWTNSSQNFSEPPRMTFQKHYGIQNTGISYNPNYQPGVNNAGIRLPVVNPKEIDVRTAAMQKQNSRQDMFQEHKFNPNYQISGDKKNFLNDLPPRFANQYRYWQNAQENQYNDNKFRDDNFKPNASSPMFNQQRSNTQWAGQMPENFQQPPWWKPENPPNFNYTPNMNVQPSYFTPVNNVPTYQNIPYNAQITHNKTENQPYLPSTIGQPMQTLQSLVASPNFNSTLNSFIVMVGPWPFAPRATAGAAETDEASPVTRLAARAHRPCGGN